jgi:hypothetical protein
MKPSFGVDNSGSVISALIPHTTVVSPTRDKEDPSAVVIEPDFVNISAGSEHSEHMYQR